MTTCRSGAATQSKNRMMKKIWVVAAISAVLLMVMCSFSQSRRGHAASRYQLVFSDEFDLKDGAQPNPKVWQRSVRGTSRWNRWISKSSDVVFIRDGKLVCRAIPNTSERGDTATMLTGAVDTRSSFAFQYGKIELRMRTNMLPGNFPAAWLLPKQPAPPHPYSGEIDIVEFFGLNPDSYHTAHSFWTTDPKQAETPRHSFHAKGRCYPVARLWTGVEQTTAHLDGGWQGGRHLQAPQYKEGTQGTTVALRPPVLYHPQPERRRPHLDTHHVEGTETRCHLRDRV